MSPCLKKEISGLEWFFFFFLFKTWKFLVYQFSHEEFVQSPKISPCSTWLLCCPVSSPLFASTNVGLVVPLPIFILSLCAFHCAFSSHTGCVLWVYVWVHFSLRDSKTRKSCQSQLSCHHQSGLWIQTQRWRLVCLCTVWLVFLRLLA